MSDAKTPWMHVARALDGESEIAGSADNPRIVELFRVSGTPQFKDDETAWCAAATNGCLVCSGYVGTRSALASSYASFGADLGGRPDYGCVVLFHPLSKGASGHVSFFVRDNGDGTIDCLGGNQSNKFKVSTYSKTKVRSYRWPVVKGPLPASTTLPTILTLAPQDAPDHVRAGVAPAPPTPIVKVAPANNFERVHPIIAKWEGADYTNHPRDKGGPTKYGITQQRLSEARGQEVSAVDVRVLAYDEALAIFKRYYWTPLRCDELPIALALMAYNAGVNSGPKRGARFLQMALNRQGHGLDEDGDVGPRTITAAATCRDVAQAVRDYSAIYEAYYRRLDDFDVFGNGWLNRLNDVTPKALAWSSERPFEPIVILPPLPKPGEPMAPSPPTQFNAALDECLRELAAAQRPILDRYLKVNLTDAGAAIPEPAPATQPPTNTTPVIKRPGTVVGTIIATAIAMLMAKGDLGTPFGFGQVPTDNGSMAAILALASPFIGASGIFGKIGSKLLPLIQAGAGAIAGKK